MRLARQLVAAATLAASAFTVPVLAADLVVGLSADVTAIDPHYHNLTPNNAVAAHLFDYLVLRSEKSQPIPGLATEWKAIEPTVWEFKLRRGVKFSDGSEFTAADVVASIDRVPKVPNSPSPFTAYTKQIAKIDVVDPYTIRFRTVSPYPLMPTDLTQIAIVSKGAAGASTEEFNSGKAAIGTGPYKLVRYAKGDRIELVRNDTWWGGRTPWEKVTLRLVTNDAARVAALLSGDVQAIENVPTADVARLKGDKRLAIYRQVSDRLMYVHLDSDRASTPFVTAKDGKPLDRNPLKDANVRKALSIAVNRPLVVERVMENEAVPAGQLVPDFLFGATKNLKVEKYDPEGARKLLAQAGYPDGFALTLHATNNRYVNDAKIAQALAQMWTRIGVKTDVVAMPSATFFPQATDLKFSVLLVGWSTGTGESSSSLKALLMTFNRDRGYGTANRGRYSNGKVDALTEDALATVDDTKREAYLQRAAEIAVGDTGIIPLHFQVSLWATRDGIAYVPRVDEQTLAHRFSPRK
ncbi:MAG TPA: ABC transporter substrate-binding protein [Casimicrobiaceae bacterium]|jgi:peptide/nickel transport system substrate-binding protein|nr:ABC transporter substrate-binding protein [Casimicrobiaceae bacterium]